MLAIIQPEAPDYISCFVDTADLSGRRDIPHAHSNAARCLGGVGLEVLCVLGCMPGGRIVARWPYRSRPDPEGPVLRAFYFRCEFVLKACPRRWSPEAECRVHCLGVGLECGAALVRKFVIALSLSVGQCG
jgi:hypothetical protein